MNLPEAEKIVETIASLLNLPEYIDKTFGVIALQGNQQAVIIENLLLKKIGEKSFFERKIVCGKSASFQGDERDIIFLSLVTATNHRRSALVRPEDERRFNVAASRAKEQLWLFHSIEQQDLSNTDDLRYKLLDHCLNIRVNGMTSVSNELITTPRIKEHGTQPSPFDSWFEVDIYNEIISKGYSVYPQYKVAGGRFKIDLVAFLPNGTKIAIECDGDAFHGPEHFQNDISRQNILERCGWQFFRVTGGLYYLNRQKALEPLWEILGSNQGDNTPPDATENQTPISENVLDNEMDGADNNLGVSSADAVDVHQEPTELTDETDVFDENSNNSFSGIKSDKMDYLESCRDILIFTDNFNVYRFEDYDGRLWQDALAETQFEEGEQPLYVTGTNNYSGFLLTAYENGKVAKVYLNSFKTKTNRSRLKNAYSELSKLVFIEHIREDLDLIAISSINKVLLFDTSQINPKASKSSSGVQVMRPRDGSHLIALKKPDEIEFVDPDYYRKNIPATGSFLKNSDSY